MKRHKNTELTRFSKDLRAGMTKEEKKLWYEFLKELPVTINRQKVFGNYIADFYCAQYKVAIDLDGSQHFSDDGEAYDKERTKYFTDLGIKVLRYSNLEIKKNFRGVCEDILKYIPVY